MQAAVFKGVGQPLSVQTRPDPAPAAGEIVLRVGRCGICGTDLSMTDGSGQTYETDSIIGHEFAGEVAGLGAGVTGFKVGDRVTAMAASVGYASADSFKRALQRRFGISPSSYANRFADRAPRSR